MRKKLIGIGICLGLMFVLVSCKEGGNMENTDKTDEMVQEETTISEEEAMRNIASLKQLRECAQKGEMPSAEVEESIKNDAVLLKDARIEDIREELLLLLMSDHPEYLMTAYEMGLTQYFMPEFDVLAESEIDPTVCKHTIKMVQSVKATEVLRLAGLFHDFARPACAVKGEGGSMTYNGHDIEGAKIAETIMKRLEFDKDMINQVAKLIRYHDYKLTAEEDAISKAIDEVGKDTYFDLLELLKGDILAQIPNPSNKKLTEMEKIIEMSQKYK